MRHAIVLLVAAVGAIGGCASGHKMAPVRADWSRNAALSEDQRRQLESSMTNEDMANLLDVKVRAKLPTKIAVAKLDERACLQDVPAEETAGWEKLLCESKSVLGVRPVTSFSTAERGRFGESATLSGLRLAAARMDCELLLAYLQADGGVDNYNDAAALYWTFVGLWLVPGNVYEHKTVMHAVLVDTRTGTILGTAAGGCSLKTLYAAAYGGIAHDKLRAQTPVKALAELQHNSAKMVRETIEAATRRAQVR